MKQELTAQIAHRYAGCDVFVMKSFTDVEAGKYKVYAIRNDDIEIIISDTTSGVDFSDCQLILWRLEDIRDEDAVEVGKIINPEFADEKQYRLDSIGALPEFHPSIKCVSYSYFISHPDIMQWVKSDCIQIDTEDFDLVRGVYSNMGMDYADEIPDNYKEVIDFLRASEHNGKPKPAYDLDGLIDANCAVDGKLLTV